MRRNNKDWRGRRMFSRGFVLPSHTHDVKLYRSLCSKRSRWYFWINKLCEKFISFSKHCAESYESSSTVGYVVDLQVASIGKQKFHTKWNSPSRPKPPLCSAATISRRHEVHYSTSRAAPHLIYMAKESLEPRRRRRQQK